MDTQSNTNIKPIFIVSGGKGIAGHTMVHSLLIQYPENKVPVIVLSNIQTEEKIIQVVQQALQNDALITHSMVNSKLRHQLIDECKKHSVEQIDFMGPLADFVENEMGLQSVNTPGLYRRINAQYFDRIDAIEYTMNNDDGLNAEKLKNAEIVLTGVSRAGKTPLSVYMSMFGWKVANIPLVKGIDPPKELFELDPKRVFGLKISSVHLIPQRYKRLRSLNNESNTDYVDKKLVNEEIRYAQSIFEKGNFTTINVTNKPIETSANEIIGLISNRFGYSSRKIKNIDK